MNPELRRRSLVLISGAFVLLIIIVIALGWVFREQTRATQRVDHTLRVEQQLTELLSSMQDAETGQRGFLLTRDEQFLAPYHAAVDDIPGQIDALRDKFVDNPQQLARLRQLERTIAMRLARLDDRLELFLSSGAVNPEGLIIGKRLMDDIRLQLNVMRNHEDVLLARRMAHADRLLVGTIAGLVLTGLMLIGISIAVVRLLNAQIVALAISANELAVINRDLTAESRQRKAAEAQTRQLQKMEAVGQLTGGIAHDFNNMLAIVVGSLDLAKRRLARTQIDSAQKCIDNAMEGATRASQLTARLMAFSRQQPLEPQVTDPNKLVSGMSELLRRTLGEQVMVETVLGGGVWKTIIDPGQLESALVNLAVNGRDAMPDGGRLTIETGNAELDDRYAAEHDEVTPGQYVMISVSDTGTGMGPDVLTRVFEPFYTTKGVGKGTGLGLSQVFGFIKQSRGHVKLYSEPGQGTTVKLYLPRASTSDEALLAGGPGSAAVLAELPRARGEEIVLVVEDDERVRHTSVDALRELGYTVVQASDARQALAVIEVQPKIDLVFTDVVMPDMNGRQLVEEIGKRWPGLRILYTTGYTRNAIVHNGMLDAGVSLLPKPFTIEQLALKVRQVMDRPLA